MQCLSVVFLPQEVSGEDAPSVLARLNDVRCTRTECVLTLAVTESLGLEEE
jgi:hypothetical protein